MMHVILTVVLALSAFVAQPPADRSLDAMKQRCEAGNADDCSRVGTSFIDKRLRRQEQDEDGIKADYTEAARYYAKACDRGSALGCYQQGWVLGLGSRYFPDGPERASRLFKKACDADNAEGCDALASQYEYGTGGLVTNPATTAALRRKAIPLFEGACSRGNAESCGRAAYAYATGAGVAVDRDRADRLFEKACKGGEKMSCTSPLWRTRR